ncbi:hypothetical protein KP509_26G008300 [Ceratopteris richardii]|uniref:NAC domain-containing protein n=1 Tax=Ceratopteris richardii TaxID=49495 RepID=A0A8T2RK57_CERRI|nr:hypothetical protein KP509_26G008300 [Ceratopteris richardii]KAH7296085.1 hypothetical protein KP509_26G008300 [Ceratopteris richardii]KAH7296086.1 hypothetical protein KP509_26G008300 [Ceratopteris richardii]KAH7296087.1 hypothetical protein KP509_26G008300 [Ceratopteris richardii]KAH7296088.1 hypothetical protein KP509_26G008300 [Ceratopteris richardii]
MEQEKLPPGFRFSPTDEELVLHYLKNMACGKDCSSGIVAEVDIYKYEPWDLPEKASLPSRDPVWYFFNSHDRRHSHSARINRTTSKGYWKATGKDRKVWSGSLCIGTKKTLIYYEGRAPNGRRTDWIMHEYKLDEDFEKRSKVVCSATLCRIRKKGGPGPRNGEQFGAPVHIENIECLEDANDNLGEIAPESSLSGDNILPAVNPPGVIVPEEVLDTELDVQTFLESFLSDNQDFLNLEAQLGASPAMEYSLFGQHGYSSNTGDTVLDQREIFLALEGRDMQESLHPTFDEVSTLTELLRLPDEGQYHMQNSKYCHPGTSSDTFNHSNNNQQLDGIKSESPYGNYIEMNDMESPLDNIILRSPSYYFAEEPQSPPDMFNIGAVKLSSDLPYTNQGEAAQRLRLKVVPRQQNGAICNSKPIVLEVGSIYNRKESEPYIIAKPEHDISSSDATTDAPDEYSLLMTADYANKIQPSLSAKVSFIPSLMKSTSGHMEETLHDCEAGLGGSSANSSDIHEYHQLETDVSPQANASLRAPRDKHLISEDEGKEIDKLISKVKALALDNIAELENNLSSSLNEKVSALGKPTSRFFASTSYTNPYCILRGSVVTSLCHLGLAVFLLLFVFLGLHLIMKFMLYLVG